MAIESGNLPVKPVEQGALFEALENIKKIKERIELVDSIQYKVSKLFAYSKYAKAPDQVDITSCTDVALLHEVLGFVIQKMEFYQAAQDASGYKSVPVSKWMNVPLQHWKEDLVLRLQILDKENQLSAIEEDEKFIMSKIDPELVESKKTASILDKYTNKGE